MQSINTAYLLDTNNNWRNTQISTRNTNLINRAVINNICIGNWIIGLNAWANENIGYETGDRLEAAERIRIAYENQATVLNLAGLQITTLPQAIGNLHNLQDLNLSRTRLTNLPESIGDLYSLVRLDISDTNIVDTDLPESICALKNLQEIFWPKPD